MPMPLNLNDFKHIILVDYEFSQSPGNLPVPICVVFRDFWSGHTTRLWEEALYQLREPPYPIGLDSLLVSYYASAEILCHFALGWPAPAYVLDLYAEFRNVTNGLWLPCGSGLLGALMYYGLDGIDAVDKDSMRALALRGGPWTAAEEVRLLDYCEGDVIALADLLPRMLPHIHLPQALLRGRYMVAAARMEYTGAPIDTKTFRPLSQHWTTIQDALIAKIDIHYGVYRGRTFKREQFQRYLDVHRIAWPQLETGALALDRDTFKRMATRHSQLQALRELRESLSNLRLAKLAVGVDGRNRCLLSAFRARTGRNQPSNTQFIFGPARWIRFLIQPQSGLGLGYIDWCQQEFGIAAALSGDKAMQDAYMSGDPYLRFAQQAGAVPLDGVRETYEMERALFKECALAVQYGMGAHSLAERIEQPVAYAQDLLASHRRTYPVFWRWSDAVVTYAMLYNKIHTVFGWTLHVGSHSNHRSLRNFPMQANGAEMLRLAICLATERGVRVCAPLHDAILIEAPLEALEQAIAVTQQAMAEASRIILSGFELRSDVKRIGYPDRYIDERGLQMWNTVQSVLWELASRKRS